MKHSFAFSISKLLLIGLCLTASGPIYAQKTTIVDKNKDGLYVLNEAGASYFANLSLNCVTNEEEHYIYRLFPRRFELGLIDTSGGESMYPALEGFDDQPLPHEIWPSFYGCLDWHSAVHNHWCLIKLLKDFPNIPEAQRIREHLNVTFQEENIAAERRFFEENEYGFFEFPYGMSWLLKVAEELKDWDDPDAKRWLVTLQPLVQHMEEAHLFAWQEFFPKVLISGSHDSPSLGLSFGYDYAVAFEREDLKELINQTAREYFGQYGYYALSQEPVEYDFMSGSLLTVDLMRKVLSGPEFATWLRTFNPELLSMETVSAALAINRVSKHDEWEAHWDGYHLNRIWCLNGVMKSSTDDLLTRKVKKAWIKEMNAMWDYAQESIGKDNYDIDHWLSSFSVFALQGYSN